LADIHFIRHAHYTGHMPGYHAPDDAELSPEGRRAAIAAAGSLPTVAGIVSSPLQRALQTAELLAGHSGVPLLDIIPELREWRSPMVVQGIPSQAFPEDYSEWRAKRILDPTSHYGDGESEFELRERARRVSCRLSALADRYGPVLAVSHKILLRSLEVSKVSVFDPNHRDEWLFLELRTAEHRGQRIKKNGSTDVKAQPIRHVIHAM
jgi:probable phosphoglycerate mutase